MTWTKDSSTPASVYRSGEFEILYDPAGPVEGERGGWYVWKGTQQLGVRFTLADAKGLAEANRATEPPEALDLMARLKHSLKALPAIRQLTKDELREGPDVRERSLRLERETGADSIATIERVYERRPSGAIECVWPRCEYARHDPVALWRHVHDLRAHPGVHVRSIKRRAAEATGDDEQ
jgi:hypothetical protein